MTHDDPGAALDRLSITTIRTLCMDAERHASAPLRDLQQRLGFTPERIVRAAHEQ